MYVPLQLIHINDGFMSLMDDTTGVVRHDIRLPPEDCNGIFRPRDIWTLIFGLPGPKFFEIFGPLLSLMVS